MTIAFFLNVLNHHQVAVADELYCLLGSSFSFVSCVGSAARELKGGEDYSDRPYHIQSFASEENYSRAKWMAEYYDVCVFGGYDAMDFQLIRSKTKKISFVIGERALKRGLLNICSPGFLKEKFYYNLKFKFSNTYKLCASAYTAIDDYRLSSYKGKHFRWGYFVSKQDFNDESKDNFTTTSIDAIKLIWCGRFIRWKHPELAVLLVERLVSYGYQCSLKMFGDGPLKKSIIKKVSDKKLSSFITFWGNCPNSQIRKSMRESDILLATSDKQEGWGVVVNEAMLEKCVVVGSDEMGSVPFLINDSENGMIFQSESLRSLFDKTKFIIDDPTLREKMAENAFKEITSIWSPQNAAASFIELSESLMCHKKWGKDKGPCSLIIDYLL